MTRQEAIDRILDHIDVHKYREPEAVRILEALDMAIEALEQPEIIRCNDCKWWIKDHQECVNPNWQGPYDEDTHYVTSSDFYCGYAEKMETMFYPQVDGITPTVVKERRENG